MKKRRRNLVYLILPSIAVLVLLGGILAGTSLWQSGKGAHADGPASTGNMQQGFEASLLPMRPMYKMAVKMGAVGNPLAGQGGLGCLTSTTLPVCYSPRQIQTAYGARPLIANGLTGKGRAITIIDAFQAPTVRRDLHIFDQLFGLKDPQLNIIAPFGLTPFNPKDPNQTGWAGEIALDVEWAHAMAPGATINLVLANVQQNTIPGQLNALLQAINFTVQHNLGSVITQSFGVGEGCLSPNFIQQADAIYQKARAQNQTVFASAGDTGSAVLQCNAQGAPVALAQGVNFPASDPFVTGVSGTTLLAAQSGAYIRETAWNEVLQSAGATGGGFSKVFALPTFQTNIVKSTTRGVGDIAFDADPLTGVPVVTSSLMPGQTVILPIGGTSLGSPLAAGMAALLDQAAGGKRLGFMNPVLYALSQQPQAYAQAFHDIKVGSNTFVFQNNNQIVTIPGFPAGAGWDAPTGLGTPNIAHLAQILLHPTTTK